ncbi:MAG TPA: AAA family ATPase [Gemmataceae bacterium]|nr:AAA family ATPase [Gemmataceae bacterium]
MSTLDAFFDRMLSASPFTDNRINSPSDGQISVAAIHNRPLERLIALAREARDECRGLGAVLWGEAGIGKSHLLARLASWAAQDKNACFVYLHNLQAGPGGLPRSLLRAVVSILTRGQAANFADTLLFRLVNAGVREALDYAEDQNYSWFDVHAAFDQFTTAASADDPSRAALVDRTSYRVLFHFFRSAYQARYDDGDEHVARLAVRWLGGEALDPAEAKELGLPPHMPPDEPVALTDNQQIKQVLVALSRLALCRQQPFILCFDQVDNLDTDQAAALSRFLEALLDSAPNLFVILAGVQATLYQWRQEKVIQDSAWDRLAQFEISLHRIQPDQGRAIIAARLEHFLRPFTELEALQQVLAEDSLFPLGEPWFSESLGSRAELRPRDVINRAAEAWRRQQESIRQRGDAVWLASWNHVELAPQPLPDTVPLQERVDREIDKRLQEQVARRQAEPFGLPPSAEALAGMIATLLDRARQAPGFQKVVGVRRRPASRSGARFAYDLIVESAVNEGTMQRVGLLCLVTASATSVCAALRRLVRDPRPPDRLLLITDEREPLPDLGRKGREYLDRLYERSPGGFQHLQLTFPEYARLDALEAVLGLARSGDLEIELPGGRALSVEPREVLDSYQRRGLFQQAPVLGQILLPGVNVPVANRG